MMGSINDEGVLMSDIFSGAEKLHYKFYGDPSYRKYGDNQRTWKAVELLSMFVDASAYLAAQPYEDERLMLWAITPSHLYSVKTDEPPAVSIEALRLSRLLVRGDLGNKARPTIQVALHMPNQEDPVVLAPEATYNDRAQLDELLALLPILRNAVL